MTAAGGLRPAQARPTLTGGSAVALGLEVCTTITASDSGDDDDEESDDDELVLSLATSSPAAEAVATGTGSVMDVKSPAAACWSGHVLCYVGSTTNIGITCFEQKSVITALWVCRHFAGTDKTNPTRTHTHTHSHVVSAVQTSGKHDPPSRFIIRGGIVTENVFWYTGESTSIVH